MNKTFFIIMLLIVGQFACTSETPTANNANQTVNTNKTETNVISTNTNSANANVANVAVKPAEPKVYTDANEALADGKKLIDLSKNKEAIEVLKQAVKLNPDLAEAHFQMGIAYGLIEAEKKEAVSLEGDTNSNTNTNSKTPKKAIAKDAPITDSEKAYNEAIKAYSKYLVKNPKDDSAQFNLARCYSKLNKDKEAEKAVRKAITMNPSNSEYQAELGAILIKFTKYQEAIGILKKALKLDENNSRAESLLEKAEAGRKREDYGKPKEAPVEKK